MAVAETFSKYAVLCTAFGNQSQSLTQGGARKNVLTLGSNSFVRCADCECFRIQLPATNCHNECMLIIMTGLPGTGKSTVARELAQRLDATILSKDVVRHALFSPNLIEYSVTQDDFVIEILLLTAVYIWSIHPEKTIILDGRTFSRASQRRHVIAFAKQAKQNWRIIECICNDEIAKTRLVSPDSNHPAGNRTPTLYDRVKEHWEPMTESRLVLRTDQPIQYEDVVQQLEVGS